MNEREALAFVERDARAIATMGDAIVRIAQRLRERATVEELADSPALPAAAQATPDPTRCYVCGWPLAESRAQGCVAGDCSYRPAQGTPEHDRIKDRLRAQMSAPAAAQADWEEPSIDECLDAYDDGLKSQGEQRATHTDGIAAVRALMIGANMRPYEGALTEIREALGLSEHDDHELVIDEIRRLRSRPAPSQALVEAADAMRETLHRVGAVLPSDVEEIDAQVAAYDLARSSLPAAKKDGGS